MKKTSLLFISIFLMLTFTGCDLGSDSRTPLSDAELAGFLWKPRSESSGAVVVLLPPGTRGQTSQFATISGSFGSETAPLRHEHHNGGRPHFYFSKPGGAYGENITVQAPLTNGSVVSVVVPNGAHRFEK